MELQKLQRVTVDALEDIKAHDIKVFDTLGQSSEFDRVIVATGNSNRQTRALAWNVVQKVKENGGRVVSVEGTDTGEWVLVDLGDVVVHIMQPTIRQYYGLEELWGAKPVRLRTLASQRTRATAAAASLARASVAPEVAARGMPAAKTGRAKSAAKAVPKSGKSATGKRTQTTTAKSAPRNSTRRAAKPALNPAAKKAAEGRSPNNVTKSLTKSVTKRVTKSVTNKATAKARSAARSAPAPAAKARAAQVRSAKSRPAKKT